ncbi:MAG TPA: VOC family protein [Kofleriaceae bacterium]|nr:VOC family protein [Kofleriaceae bacterium]
MGNPIVPCIWLDDQAEAAGACYAGLFPGSRVVTTSHYPDDADNPSGKPRGSVLTVEVEVAGLRFTLLNGGPRFRPNPSVSFFVLVDDAAEVDRLHGALAAGGHDLMELGSYPWSERYAWVADRWGVTWQVMLVGERPPARIVPSLMFVGDQLGHADEAMRFYTSIFPDSRIEQVQRFAPGQGPDQGVMHARFVLAGEHLAAMDGPGPHPFRFDEGLSLQVRCADQAEVDRYWDQLVAGGGSHGPCGWLKDRFGVSWQVTPSQVSSWMTSTDRAARDRAFAAMMKMSKPDVAALERAFAGT